MKLSVQELTLWWSEFPEGIGCFLLFESLIEASYLLGADIKQQPDGHPGRWLGLTQLPESAAQYRSDQSEDAWKFTL